jgi:hypothetical protein
VSKFAAAFESITKSNESCVLLWDVENQKSLKVPSTDSCCSLSWLPQHDSVLFTGNSMGWIRGFDIRSPSATPAMTWSAHPANRPRKVRGIHPCFLDGNIIASFSDAVGDYVKVWDLRMVENIMRSQKKGGSLPRCFSVNPYNFNFDEYNTNFVTSASVSDVAWSPTRSEVLAVSTSHSKGIFIFKCDVFKLETMAQPETIIPVSFITSPEPVKSLSWQWIDSNDINTSRPSIIETLNKNLEKINATSLPPNDVNPNFNHWEAVSIDYTAVNSSFSPDIRSSTTQTQPKQMLSSSSKRLLGVTIRDNLLDSDVRDAVPFGFNEQQKLIVPSRNGIRIYQLSNHQLFLEDVRNSTENNNRKTLHRIQNYLEDINYIMKDRATAGYSFDASANLDVLSEELEFYNKCVFEDIYFKELFDFKLSEYYQLTAKLQETQRIWTWIDRNEASVHQTKLSLHNCGILTLFSSFMSSSSIVSESSFDTATGAILFSSELRSLIKKICGWVAENDELQMNKDVFSSGKSNSDVGSVGGSSDYDGENNNNNHNKDLLEMLVEDYAQTSSYERAAVLALWHGDLDLAVQVLHDALENYSNTLCSPGPSNQHQEENGTEDDDYMQTIALVASCIAGYYVRPMVDSYSNPSRFGGNPLMNWTSTTTPTSNSVYGNQFRHNNPPPTASSNHMPSSDRSSWKTMCLLTMNKLKKFRRNWVNYLLAGCHFLLLNVDEDNKQNEDNLLSSYSNILNDEKIFLEDRLSFASNFLNDKEFLHWMEQRFQAYRKQGNIEGLILTGISSQGVEILQNYLDKTSDIQTVALITCRILSTSLNLVKDSSYFTADDSEMNSFFQKISKWIYYYRQLLIQWECYTERAHLDIEISQRIKKNNENKNRLTSSRLPSTASHLNLLSSSQHGGDKSSNNQANNLATNPSSSNISSTSNTGTSRDKMKITTSHLGGKASQSLSMPVYEGIFSNMIDYMNNSPVPSGSNGVGEENMNFYYIKLKCNFCGQLLPSDELPSKNMDSLRVQKSILNFCSNCNKQLPRCYVCQLYMVSSSFIFYYSCIFNFVYSRAFLIRM